MSATPSPKSPAVFNLEEAAVVFKTFLAVLDMGEKTCSIARSEFPPELARVGELCRQIVFEIDKEDRADVSRIKELNAQLGQVVPGQFQVRVLF